MDGMNLYNKAYSEALVNNERETERWKTYLKEHEEVKENLRMYGKQLKVDILIPLGSKAFIPGQLYHTSEVLASHGSGYFSECTASQANTIIDHRIQTANEMLKKYEKERELFTNKMEVPFAEDAFSGKEIIEEYDEAREEVWRQEHRKRTREYKQREAEERKKGIDTDQDIFDRLEELELMEELEQEMDSLEVPVEDDEQLRKLMSGEIKLNEKKRLAHHSNANETSVDKNDDSKAIAEVSIEAKQVFENDQFEIEITDEESTSGSDQSEDDVSPEFMDLLHETKAMNKKDKIAAFKRKLLDIDVRLRQSSVSIEEKVDLCNLRYEVEEALDFLQPSWESTMDSKVVQSDDSEKKSKTIKFAATDSVKIIDNREAVVKMNEPTVDQSSSHTLELMVVHSPDSSGVSSVNSGSEIQSPSDIYRLFEHCLRKEENVASTSVKKSILKNRNKVLGETHLPDAAPVVRKPRQKQEAVAVDIIGDVIEHKVEMESEASVKVSAIKPTAASQKKVSRFKQQRS